MKTLKLFCFGAIVLYLCLTSGTMSAQSGCGILPIKPIPPIGCKDLVPQCQCNQNGQKCRWAWLCVRS